MKKIFTLTCLMISLTSFAPENPLWTIFAKLAVRVENGRRLQAEDNLKISKSISLVYSQGAELVSSWFAKQVDEKRT